MTNLTSLDAGILEMVAHMYLLVLFITNFTSLDAGILKRLINESALKFNESALKNLLLNLTNLPLKI